MTLRDKVVPTGHAPAVPVHQLGIVMTVKVEFITTLDGESVTPAAVYTPTAAVEANLIISVGKAKIIFPVVGDT